jgi:hypothetical protein
MKGVLSVLAAVLLTANMFGQATYKMSPQVVIRDNNNALVSSGPVRMRVSILQGSETGTPIYVETHTTATNVNGLVTFELGGGTPVTGTIADVVWSTGTYFLKTETDPTGGVNYSTTVSTSRLFSESYALESTHYIGESYGGGIVFHIYDGGQHGLITATVDDSKRKQRQNGAYADTIDFRGGIGAGKIITEHVITFKEARADDTQVSANNQSGNYSDWYLPTRYDLNLLYLNRAVIGGYSEFAKGWKSTEVSSLNAWFQSFITGARFTNGKDDAVYVRVLRKF